MADEDEVARLRARVKMMVEATAGARAALGIRDDYAGLEESVRKLKEEVWFWRGKYEHARDTLNTVRGKRPKNLREAQERLVVAENDLDQARELIDGLARENADFRRELGRMPA